MKGLNALLVVIHILADALCTHADIEDFLDTRIDDVNCRTPVKCFQICNENPKTKSVSTIAPSKQALN